MAREKILTLTLKKKWFDMIKSREKKEEYRDIKPYWTKRLKNKSYDKVEFTCGYPPKNDNKRRLLFDKPKMKEGYGNLKWGAEEGVIYYVITWEDKEV